MFVPADRPFEQQPFFLNDRMTAPADLATDVGKRYGVVLAALEAFLGMLEFVIPTPCSFVTVSLCSVQAVWLGAPEGEEPASVDFDDSALFVEVVGPTCTHIDVTGLCCDPEPCDGTRKKLNHTVKGLHVGSERRRLLPVNGTAAGLFKPTHLSNNCLSDIFHQPPPTPGRCQH
jgi:hypothetical protein